MNRKLFAVASVTALMLTSCGSDESTPASAPDVTPITSSSSAPSSASPSVARPKKSDRGYYPKKVGQTSTITNRGHDTVASFVVKKITDDLNCTSIHTQEAENGHLLGVQMDVQTLKEMKDPDYPGLTLDTDPFLWKFISSQGTTFNGDLGTSAAYNCLPADKMLTDSIGPAQKATGWIILDVPATEGTLIFEPQQGLGWEYDLKDGTANA